ncbi:S-adenosyl-L-methionine-dependent methyltransferase [Clohesyomyces aquaticus]|uniref:S-adenosyl-L-methionine-dependent methyltransferase n=1 Tax=Clohesyomyces aquaticus TaxID=1231657 RepID=A0A1Y1ZX49_9PLEO|nr:S-adenosyl-L-methionine-dependent methyltransferase [Clohesyomyces aquaticus]
MSAYHNSDWAECYDLWVSKIFGSGPYEDIAIFEAILQQILDTHPTSDDARPVRIADIGSGSGRVLGDLQDYMKTSGRQFEYLGVEPGKPMLERAQRFCTERSWNEGNVAVKWILGGAEDVAGKLLQEVDSVNLVIFAAGGICHVTTDEGMQAFLRDVSRVLNEGGRAVVSILNDFIPDQVAENQTPSQDLAPEDNTVGEGPERLPSVDRPGEIYVKYPSKEIATGKIKTEEFRLDVEDGEGKALRSYVLKWDAKMFDEPGWIQAVGDAELKIREVREGGIQRWYVLERA